MEDNRTNLEILVDVRDWSLENLVDVDAAGVLLVGSWAEGRAKALSDIDIIVIKSNQETPIKNIKTSAKGMNLDIWIHSKEYLKETLNKDVSSLSDIYQKSMFLSFLSNCQIWYEKSGFVEECIPICKDWKWKSEDRIYVTMLGKPPREEWAKNAYEENMNLISRFEHNFDNNLPISHRLKDYPELHKHVDKTLVMNLYKLVIPLFEELNIEREWTEITDAKKAILQEDWSVAFVSLKDVLYFLLRRYVSPPSMERRDPSFWSFLESKIIPQEYISALEIAYAEKSN